LNHYNGSETEKKGATQQVSKKEPTGTDDTLDRGKTNAESIVTLKA
jgi:hypothetical protein